MRRITSMNLPTKSRRKRVLTRSPLEQEQWHQLEKLLEELAPEATLGQITASTSFAIEQIRRYQARILDTASSDAAHRDNLVQWIQSMRAIFVKMGELHSMLDSESPAKNFLNAWWLAKIRARSYSNTGHPAGYKRAQDHKLPEGFEDVIVHIGLPELQNTLLGVMSFLEAQTDNFRAPRRTKEENPEFLLACGMRLTIEGLGLHASMTRDQQLDNPKPTSANYSRLLRLAIELAGGTAPEDLHPAMQAGKKLAKAFVSPFELFNGDVGAGLP